MATASSRSTGVGGEKSPPPRAAEEHGGGGGGSGGGGSSGGGGTQTQDLIDLLARIATAQEQLSRPVSPLNVTQRRLALHYGALLNGLGNFGRHGETNLALLSPPATLEHGDTLVFASLIPGAATVAAYDQNGILVDRRPFELRVHVDNDDAPRIKTVEIEDDQATPFLLGIVVRVFDSSE
jgi:hypothetical protein